MVSSENHIYKDIGAIPIINTIGSVTILGGSTPIPEVAYAMDQASKSYISLKEKDPPIWTRVHEKQDNIQLHIFGMNPGEEIIVGQKLVELLS